MKKIYVIERSESDYFSSYRYRFYSLYNGARGAWHEDKEKAIQEGEAHQKIILSLHAHGEQSLSGLTDKGEEKDVLRSTG